MSTVRCRLTHRRHMHMSWDSCSLTRGVQRRIQIDDTRLTEVAVVLDTWRQFVSHDTYTDILYWYEGGTHRMMDKSPPYCAIQSNNWLSSLRGDQVRPDEFTVTMRDLLGLPSRFACCGNSSENRISSISERHTHADLHPTGNPVESNGPFSAAGPACIDEP